MDQMKRKPGRPAKAQPQPADKPAVSFARTVVEPVVPTAVALHVIVKPAWMLDEAICLRDRGTISADLRSAIEGALGCQFTLTDGVLVTADGRRMAVVDHPDRVEVVA